MRKCPKCSHENEEDTDFCAQCGTYLRWEPTSFVRAVPAPEEKEQPTEPLPAADSPPAKPPASPPPPPPPPAPVAVDKTTPFAAVGTSEAPRVSAEAVLVSLRTPGEGEAGELVTTTVEAGGQGSVVVLVRNQSGIVDNYDVQVEGIPPDWWTATPATVYLVPFGSPGGTYEDELELRFHPPRSAEAEARPWPIRVVARSRTSASEVGSAAATLVVAPFQQLESELRPRSASGRIGARYALMIRNLANAPVQVMASGADADGACRFHFKPAQFPADPGRRAGTTFTVRTSKPIWIGRPVDRRFEITVRTSTDAAAPPPLQGVFRQKAWLPWWLPVAAPLVIGAAVLVFMLLPKQSTVPDLRGKSQPQARALLQGLGLKLAAEPPDKKVSKARPGTIIGQLPAPGKHLKRGSEVSITIAVGTGKRTVPNLVGMTLAGADQALRKAGLTIILPPSQPGVDVGKAKVSSQIPAAGAVVKANQAVNVFVPTPKPPKSVKPATLPVTAGLTDAAAVLALSKLGVTVTEIRKFDEAKPGTVLEQIPPEGTKLKPGEPVQLIVSAGYPEIAYSDGSNIRLMGGFKGNPLAPLAASADVEDEPSWQPKGTLVAYRRGASFQAGSIWLVDARNRATAHPLTKGTNDRRPAFSPDGRVVAFIRAASSTDNDLCFARVSSTPVTGTCIVDPKVSVDRPTWAPDGAAIAVVAVDPVDPSQTELLEYTTVRPDSLRPADWVSQGLVTDSMHGKRPGEGAIFAAWSPDGKQVAIVANWGATDLSFFHVFMSATSQGQLAPPKPVVPQVRACEVAWRPDAGELAVMQADDCRQGVGAVARVDPTKAGAQNQLRQLGAKDPAWQPLSLNGK